MGASYAVRGKVAVITLDNPPVNGLGYDTRREFSAGVERALADAAVAAIVVTGAGKAFSGGADIKEFGSPKAVAEPNLLSLIRQLEMATKPVVAAVHSVCMGGGLELALGCHYRIAGAGTSVLGGIEGSLMIAVVRRVDRWPPAGPTGGVAVEVVVVVVTVLVLVPQRPVQVGVVVVG